MRQPPRIRTALLDARNIMCESFKYAHPDFISEDIVRSIIQICGSCDENQILSDLIVRGFLTPVFELDPQNSIFAVRNEKPRERYKTDKRTIYWALEEHLSTVVRTRQLNCRLGCALYDHGFVAPDNSIQRIYALIKESYDGCSRRQMKELTGFSDNKLKFVIEILKVNGMIVKTGGNSNSRYITKRVVRRPCEEQNLKVVVLEPCSKIKVEEPQFKEDPEPKLPEVSDEILKDLATSIDNASLRNRILRLLDHCPKGARPERLWRVLDCQMSDLNNELQFLRTSGLIKRIKGSRFVTI